MPRVRQRQVNRGPESRGRRVDKARDFGGIHERRPVGPRGEAAGIGMAGDRPKTWSGGERANTGATGSKPCGRPPPRPSFRRPEFRNGAPDGRGRRAQNEALNKGARLRPPSPHRRSSSDERQRWDSREGSAHKSHGTNLLLGCRPASRIPVSGGQVPTPATDSQTFAGGPKGTFPMDEPGRRPSASNRSPPLP